MNCDKDTDDKAVYDDKDMIKNTAQKMETETADLVTFTEEILNGKLHFLYSVRNCDDRYFFVFTEPLVST